jgi:hypothetical protein
MDIDEIELSEVWVDDEEVNVAYMDAGIATNQARDGLALEVLRERRHLPVGSEFPTHSIFSKTLMWPYHASGFEVDSSAFRALNTFEYRRYYCPVVNDTSHGIIKAFIMRDTYPARGFVKQRLLCNCNCQGLPSHTMLANPFFNALETKYETLRLLGTAVAYALLLCSYNMPLNIITRPGSTDGAGAIHQVSLRYHAQENYGPQQYLQLTVHENADGSYSVDNPIPSTSRLQQKHCVVCQSNGDQRKLMFGLSCRHSVCDGCLPQFFGYPRDERTPCGPVVEPFKCPRCEGTLHSTLQTPFPHLRTLRAPIPIYRQGLKTFYTEPAEQSMRYTFFNHISWHLHATNSTQDMLEELKPIRFRVHAQVLQRDQNNVLHDHQRTVLMRHLRLVDQCHDAWTDIETFLHEKRVFLGWCYNWEEAFPEELLNRNNDYFKQVLERDAYLEMRRYAMQKHHMVTRIS